MSLSRLEFLKCLSALGFGALGADRIFAAPEGWKPAGKPNLTFGVISDTHIATDSTGLTMSPRLIDRYFRLALEYFKEINVDAVAHCGDWAHRGTFTAMKFHADVWHDVFGKTGGPVKLFVLGNHDLVGSSYGNFGPKTFPDIEVRKKWMLQYDTAEKMERIWGEPYHDVWHKEVKGYHFFGRQWCVDDMKLAELVKKETARGSIKKGDAKPFFMLSHIRPSSKCAKALNPWPNGVGFFGHWHRSASTWTNIRFYGSSPSIAVPSCDARGGQGIPSRGVASVDIGGGDRKGKARQGYVVRVYDDVMTIERREFGLGGKLGCDWVMPLGKFKPHPLSLDECKKKIGVPQFPAGAALTVSKGKVFPFLTEVQRREIAKTGQPYRPAKTQGIIIKIPNANGNPESRAMAYEAEFLGEKEDGSVEKVVKAIFAVGCNLAIGHEPDGGVTTLALPLTDLPKSVNKKVKIAVYPLTSLGTKGKAIGTEVVV